jgi:flagellar protein FliS
MFSRTLKPADAYNQVRIETGVPEADPHQLILMLYDGAIHALGLATQGIMHKDIPKKGRAISNAIDIISQGLQASLKFEEGGEMAERLNALYDYMCNRLLFANLKNDLAAIEEVTALLMDLRGAWGEMQSDTTASPSNGAVS